MSIEKMKHALEGLDKWRWGNDPRGADVYIESLRQAIEQAEQCQCQKCKVALHASDCAVHSEPAYPKNECNCGAEQSNVADGDTSQDHVAETIKNVHEPVAWGVFDVNLHDMFFTKEEAHDMARLKGDGSTVAPLYTTPPQRNPLTDEEIAQIWRDETKPERTTDKMVRAFAKAIEAAMKEKNAAGWEMRGVV